jgi:D-tyrosyl-tRNA(Tyr) deacylase
MRVVLQRVKKCRVTVSGEISGEIGVGILAFLGVGPNDSDEDVRYLAEKTVHLRIFPDDEGKMNRSLLDIGGGMLIVSQFTLFGDCRKGRRPSFTGAAPPEKAEMLYHAFVEGIEKLGVTTSTGTFGAMMEVDLVNDGPVTLLLDSKGAF